MKSQVPLDPTGSSHLFSSFFRSPRQDFFSRPYRIQKRITTFLDLKLGLGRSYQDQQLS